MHKGFVRAIALASTAEERSIAQQAIAFLAKRAEAVARQADREAFAKGCTAGDAAACGRLFTLVEELCRGGDDLACVSTGPMDRPVEPVTIESVTIER